MIRLRLPLQFFGTETPSQLTAQERRMTEPVKRDVDVVSGSTKGASTPTVVEAATLTASGQTITVINSVNVTGAQLPAAIAGLGTNSFALMVGTFSTTASTSLQTGQTMMGAGPLSVVTPGGIAAVLNAPGATINGNVPGVTPGIIALASSSTLTGMAIRNETTTGGAAGVYGVGANGARVINNTITATSSSFNEVSGLRLDLTSNYVVSGNTVSAQQSNNNANGLVLLSTSDGKITGNSITAISSQSRALYILGTSGTLTVAGNTLSASPAGGAFNHAVDMTSVTLSVGSVGNTLNGGTRNVPGSVVGSIEFTDGSRCPP